MTVPDNATFGTFSDGGDLVHDDIVVGLRNGLNTRFNFKGDPGIYLPLAGGTMAGAIDMDGNSITGLPVPTQPSDAVTKAYADALVAGEAMSKVDDTNVTLSLGGTPLTSLLHAVSLTLGWTGQLSVPRGGTGNSTFTAYSVLCAGTTSTGAFQNVSGVGTTNQVLVSNGASALPTWQSVPGLVPAALTKTDDTNVTLTLGGTPSTALLQAASLTLGWTGQLSGARGGTGVNNGSNTATLAGNLNFAAAFSTSGAFAVTQTYTGITNVTFPTTGTLATTSQIPTGAALTKTDDTNVTLSLGGSPTTALVNAASLTLGWTGQLSLSRGGSNANLTAINGGIVYSNASAMAISAAGSSGQLLQSAGASTPIWTTATYPATAGTSGNFMQSNGTNWTSASPAALTKTDDTNVTLTLGGTPTTALMVATSLTLGWTGILSVARGGTGLASITSHDLLIGNGTSAATLLAPSATSGVPLISQGASADPAYGTAVVAGGGTGVTSNTAYAVLCGGTTSTNPVQSIAGVGASGQVLTSNGAGVLPTFQNATGTGTVNSGTAGQLAYYATSSASVSGGQLGNVLGTATNDSASTGYCGEFVSSVIGSGSAVGLTNASNANITSVSLTAGDWDVWGNVAFVNATGLISYAEGWISSTSATGVDASLFVQDVAWGASSNNGFSVPGRRFSLPGTTTVYLSTNCGFTGNLSACGGIYARRPR